MQENRTKKMVLCAILIALSVILGEIKIIHMPFGGSITLFSMLAATLTGYFCGWRWGLSSGLVIGLLNLVFGGQVIHPIQLVLDYILAFTVLGLSGFFQNKKGGLYIGYIVSVLSRFFISFLSGWIFFGSYAPEGMYPWAYSFVYQASYILPEMAITLVVLLIPAVHKTIFRLKNSYSNK